MIQELVIQSVMRRYWEVQKQSMKLNSKIQRKQRKKLIDSIIGENNHPDNVLYYVRHLTDNNHEASRDSTFSYEEFVNFSIKS